MYRPIDRDYIDRFVNLEGRLSRDLWRNLWELCWTSVYWEPES